MVSDRVDYRSAVTVCVDLGQIGGGAEKSAHKRGMYRKGLDTAEIVGKGQEGGPSDERACRRL